MPAERLCKRLRHRPDERQEHHREQEIAVVERPNSKRAADVELLDGYGAGGIALHHQQGND